MRYNPATHRRRSIRLKGYDYSQKGAYFVTICAHNRERLFGGIVDGEMRLNDAGYAVEKWWLELPHKFPLVKMDEYVIMPNHFHGIVVIVGADLRVCPTPCINPKTLSDKHIKGEHVGSPLHKMIQWFKTMTTNEYIRAVKRYELPFLHGGFWQRNYYERIIRNEQELNKIREYIINNPLKWSLDSENPDREGSDQLEEEIFNV